MCSASSCPESAPACTPHTPHLTAHWRYSRTVAEVRPSRLLDWVLVHADRTQLVVIPLLAALLVLSSLAAETSLLLLVFGPVILLGLPLLASASQLFPERYQLAHERWFARPYAPRPRRHVPRFLPRLLLASARAPLIAVCGVSLVLFALALGLAALLDPYWVYPLLMLGLAATLIILAPGSEARLWAADHLADDPDEDAWAHGWKLARICREDDEFWLEGVAGGTYQASARARCLLTPHHRPPVAGCTCGFHAWRTAELADVYAAQLSQGFVLIEVELSGEILCFARGVRAELQDVLGVHLPPCACGAPPTHLRTLQVLATGYCVPVCASCAPPDALTLATLAGHLGAEVHAAPR